MLNEVVFSAHSDSGDRIVCLQNIFCFIVRDGSLIRHLLLYARAIEEPWLHVSSTHHHLASKVRKLQAD